MCRFGHQRLTLAHPPDAESVAQHLDAERVPGLAGAAVAGQGVPGPVRALDAGVLVAGAHGDALGVLLDAGHHDAEVRADLVVAGGAVAQPLLHQGLVDGVGGGVPEFAGREVHAHELMPVVGHPAQRVGRVHDLLDRRVQAHRLEQAHRPVADRDGAGALVEVLVALEGDGRQPVAAEGVGGGDPGRAVADDGDICVVGHGDSSGLGEEGGGLRAEPVDLFDLDPVTGVG